MSVDGLIKACELINELHFLLTGEQARHLLVSDARVCVAAVKMSHGIEVDNAIAMLNAIRRTLGEVLTDLVKDGRRVAFEELINICSRLTTQLTGFSTAGERWFLSDGKIASRKSGILRHIDVVPSGSVPSSAEAVA